MRPGYDRSYFLYRHILKDNALEEPLLYGLVDLAVLLLAASERALGRPRTGNFTQTHSLQLYQ